MYRKVVASIRDAVCAVLRTSADGEARFEGSAFCVSPRGHYLTAYQVLNPPPPAAPRTVYDRLFLVRVRHDQSLELFPVLEVVHEDPASDTALVRAQVPGGAGKLQLFSGELKLGQSIVTYAYPDSRVLGQTPSGSLNIVVTPRVDAGLVSSLYMDEGRLRVELTTSTYPGETGAPACLGESGHVVGVVQGPRMVPSPVGNLVGPTRIVPCTAFKHLPVPV